MKTQFNLQMTLTKEETIGLEAIFVKRADILNGVGIEIDVLWKSIVSSFSKNNVIDNKTINE